MNKAELIEEIADATDLSKAAAGRVLNATIDSISKALRRSNSVVLVGFGTFNVRRRAARKGRNPKTGELINIPSMIVPTFRAGKALKKTVNK